MTITRHTAADLFFLLIAALVCGLAISCIYVILSSASSASCACRISAFPKYNQFMSMVAVSKEVKIFTTFADATLCLLFAFGLLAVSFICNSGNFRLLSLLSMLFGYFMGVAVFGKLINCIFFNLLFAVKWITEILIYPFAWMAKQLFRVTLRIHDRILKARNKALMKKYTLHRLSNIAKITEFGLIDKYYKEVLK